MQAFDTKVALANRYVPPNTYGSASRIHRVFLEIDPDSYLVITGSEVEALLHSDAQAPRLACPYHVLPSEWRRIPFMWGGTAGKVVAWLNVWLRVLQRARNIRRIVRKEGCRKVISFTGDLEDIPSAWLAARWAHCEFSAVVDDDYVTQWTEPHKRWFARQVGPFVFRNADKVFTVSAELGTEYRRRYGCDCHVLPTPVMGPVVQPSSTVPMGRPDHELRILFSGTVYDLNADVIACLIRAAALVVERRVVVHLYTWQTRDDLRAKGIDGDYELHATVSPARIQEIQRASDILFLGLGFDPRHATVVRTSFPTKLTDYLVSGRPILALLPAFSCTARFLREHGCAEVVDQPDAAALAEGIRRLLGDAGHRTRLVRRAFDVATREFNADTVVRDFVETINRR
jgi:hypothetical protein